MFEGRNASRRKRRKTEHKPLKEMIYGLLKPHERKSLLKIVRKAGDTSFYPTLENVFPTPLPIDLKYKNRIRYRLSQMQNSKIAPLVDIEWHIMCQEMIQSSSLRLPLAHERPKQKCDMVEFLLNRLYGSEWENLKRRTEIDTMHKFSELVFVTFFELTKSPIVIPEHIILLVMGYMLKGTSFLNSIAPINEQFYIIALKSWDVTVQISYRNVYKIPTPILYNCRSIVFKIAKEFSGNKLVYICKSLKSVERIEVKGKFIQRLFRSMDDSEVVFKSLSQINITTVYRASFRLDLPKARSLPVLKELGLAPEKMILSEDAKVLGNIKKLSLLEHIKDWVDYKFCESTKFIEKMSALEVLHVYCEYNKKFLKMISNLKELRELRISMRRVYHYIAIKKHVYSEDFGTLEELILDFGGNEIHDPPRYMNPLDGIKRLKSLRKLTLISHKYFFNQRNRVDLYEIEFKGLRECTSLKEITLLFSYECDKSDTGDDIRRQFKEKYNSQRIRKILDARYDWFISKGGTVEFKIVEAK